MPTLFKMLHPRRMRQRLPRRAVEETLLSEGVQPRAVEVSIALVDDATIRELNARYRGLDAPTDVLSFSQRSEVAFPGAPRLLGDIVVSLDTAARQAETAGRSLDEELVHLIIHGVLHLLSRYEDVTPEGHAEMVRKGAEIWERVRDVGH